VSCSYRYFYSISTFFLICINFVYFTLFLFIKASYLLPNNVYIYLQVSIVARDGGVPPLSVQGLVVVNILRNRNPPFFLSEPYTRSVDRNLATGTFILQVSADDLDTQVLLMLAVQ